MEFDSENSLMEENYYARLNIARDVSDIYLDFQFYNILYSNLSNLHLSEGLSRRNKCDLSSAESNVPSR